MKPLNLIRSLFVLAAIYEISIGAAFLVAGPRLFAAAGIEAPNHWGYVQFPACLLIVFGLMFAAVAGQPQQRRGLILPGLGLKISYVAVTAFHWAATGIPALWKPFAVIDALFALAFLAAWIHLRAERPAA